MAYLGLSQPWDQAIQREVFAPPEYSTELPMTPQQIEAAVKREQAITQMTPQQIEAQVKQAPQAGGGLALAAIVAFLMLGA